MSIFSQINLISVLIIGLIVMPMIAGLFRPITDSRIFLTFYSLINVLIFIVSTLIALFVTMAFFYDNGNSTLAGILKSVPGFKDSLAEQDIFVYILIILSLFVVISSAFHLIAHIILEKRIASLSCKLSKRISQANKYVRLAIRSVWQFPKSILLVIAFTLLISFYSNVSSNTQLSSYIKASAAYNFIESSTLRPIFLSVPIQQIPLAINSAVDKAIESLSPEGRKLLIKVYINGVTVEEAIKSCQDIDYIATELVGNENDNYKKAKLLYNWICENISYDNQKAEAVEVDAFSVESGADVAFHEKTGICFDKASLFTAMCRATGVPVRLATGRAYNGSAWLNHSWNQIYDDKNNRWVNVDTTFGNKDNNYFDRVDFYDNHKDEEIQAEWR